MALTWDVKNVANYDAYFPKRVEGTEEYWNTTTERIVWEMLFCGVQQITEDNYKNFYARIIALRIADGHDSSHLILQDIRRHIGLRTNVSDESDKKFKARIAEKLWATAEAEARER